MKPQAASAKSSDESGRAPERIEPFLYPANPDSSSAADGKAWMEEDEDDDSGERSRNLSAEALSAQFEQRIQEEARRACEAGKQQGRQQEREAHAATLVAAIEQQKRQMAALGESFAVERDRYLQTVEREVVRLALAVAARILRREAQMDPLLLIGAVRVALGQLSASSDVTLKVPASELDLWTEAMALLPNLPVRPAVVAGDGLRLGECMVETHMGTVDLGIRSQLGEIERGFFDRPGSARHEPAAGRTEVSHQERL